MPLGTFTLTAARDSETTTETVLIDIAGVYEIEMSFKFYLYKEGNEYDDITGGLVSEGMGTYSVVKNSNNIKMSGTFVGGSHFGTARLRSSKEINYSGYTKICVEYEGFSWSNRQINNDGGLVFGGVWYYPVALSLFYTLPETGVFSVDISNKESLKTTEDLVMLYPVGNTGVSVSAAITIKKIWLS